MKHISGITEYTQVYLKPLADISDEAEKFFTSFVDEYHINKGDLIFDHKESSDIVYFVGQGLIYTYFETPKGETKIKKFSPEGEVVAFYSNKLTNVPTSFYSAKALEDSILYGIKYTDLYLCFEKYKCFETIARKLFEISLANKEVREYEMLCCSSLERYNLFCERNKTIIHRLPQYLIAAYLGIAAPSLSRLRSQK